MRTALFEKHCELGARIVDFAGWEMPMQYEHGIVHEHLAVRNAAGLFDVSHMGIVTVRGPEAEVFLDYLSTNLISGKADHTAIYTVLPSEDGGTVDDVIIYRIKNDHFFIIVNAANRQKDLKHLQKHALNYDVSIQDQFDKEGIIAIQGPKAEAIMQNFCPGVAALRFMRFDFFDWKGYKIIISRTGYTGELGYEIYAPKEALTAIWDAIMHLGKPEGLEAVGLAARDTLRLEMGFALYGHELSQDIAASESVSSWTIKWDKDFLGKDKAQGRINSGRSQVGLLLKAPGIARDGYPIFKDGSQVGTVTSGTHAPSLKQSIAIGLVTIPKVLGEELFIEIRGRPVPAEVVNLPFYKRG